MRTSRGLPDEQAAGEGGQHPLAHCVAAGSVTGPGEVHFNQEAAGVGEGVGGFFPRLGSVLHGPFAEEVEGVTPGDHGFRLRVHEGGRIDGDAPCAGGHRSHAERGGAALGPGRLRNGGAEQVIECAVEEVQQHPVGRTASILRPAQVHQLGMDGGPEGGVQPIDGGKRVPCRGRSPLRCHGPAGRHLRLTRCDVLHSLVVAGRGIGRGRRGVRSGRRRRFTSGQGQAEDQAQGRTEDRPRDSHAGKIRVYSSRLDWQFSRRISNLTA